MGIEKFDKISDLDSMYIDGLMQRIGFVILDVEEFVYLLFSVSFTTKQLNSIK